MRGAVGRSYANSNHFHLTIVAKQNPFSYTPFSTSSDGGGRGRGRGGIGFTRAPGNPESYQPKPESRPSGVGHGRGNPVLTSTDKSSDPLLPSFSSFMSTVKSSAGRGRGTTASPPFQPQTEPPKPNKPLLVKMQDLDNSASIQPPSQPETNSPTDPKKPLLVKMQNLNNSAPPATESTQPREPVLPSNVFSVQSGTGRGKPITKSQPSPPILEENRHIKSRPPRDPRREVSPPQSQPKPKLNREEAILRALNILRQHGDGVGRGRGRGRERGPGGRGQQWEERGEWKGKEKDSYKEHSAGLYLGDDADGEKLARKLGTETMEKLAQAFEEIGARVLPSPMQDAYVDAYDTNLSIELEPEYLMGDFNKNPDIDEKPPMSLRDALEKVKPFLMKYEGIQNQQEWEEAVNQVMEQVPLMKEIVDHYSGPDRVTAKQQTEELQRVANTIPDKVPDSVKRFANRAVISLQSNPGWGFDKKCQFMDKLALDITQHYK